MSTVRPSLARNLLVALTLLGAAGTAGVHFSSDASAFG